MLLKNISLLLAGAVLITSCSSTTLIQSNPPGAKVYLNDEAVGTTPYTHKDKKIVVVGHHSPSFQSCHEQYKHDYLMNGAYHSSLENIMLDNPHIKLWTHGHTHHPFDYVIGETRVVCNPRGYEQPYGYSEFTGWDPEKVVEI